MDFEDLEVAIPVIAPLTSLGPRRGPLSAIVRSAEPHVVQGLFHLRARAVRVACAGRARGVRVGMCWANGSTLTLFSAATPPNIEEQREKVLIGDGGAAAKQLSPLVARSGRVSASGTQRTRAAHEAGAR